MTTPDPESSQADLKNVESKPSERILLERLQTKYSDFNYTDWVIEFKSSLDKALTTGLEVLGLFVYCQSTEQKT